MTLTTEIYSFKKRAYKIIPKLSQLEISDSQWTKVIESFEKHHHSHITSGFLIHTLSSAMQVPVSQLLESLRKEQPKRKRHISEVIGAEENEPRWRHKRRRGGDNYPNPLIIAPTKENEWLLPTLKESGVRVAELTPGTPTKGYTTVMYTPEKKTQVRQLLWHHRRGALFVPLTPEGDKAQRGRVNITEMKKEDIEKALPKLHYSRPGSIKFDANLEKIEAAQKLKRYIAQNQLTGASCREVFFAQGIDTILKAHGSDYHWSHLIAHFLGGEQSPENLIPGTAASNYNTLELVEQFIATKLCSLDNPVSSIAIEVIPHYRGESLIPDELVFNLTWQELDQNDEFVSMHETININTRSYQRLHSAMHRSIALFRDTQPTSEDSDDDLIQEHDLK